MTRSCCLWMAAALAIFLERAPLWAQSEPERPARCSAPLPKLAVVAVVQEPSGQEGANSRNSRRPEKGRASETQDSAGHDRENVEDLLAIELGNQPFLQLVDRQALQAVMKEHAISLTNLSDPNSALSLGKFAGADYLLYVLVESDKALPTRRKAAVRLVEVATGQVKVDDKITVSENLALSMAAVREKVLAALKPESQAANRLTVGITEFPNHSGTSRSDKLGAELQKALRAIEPAALGGRLGTGISEDPAGRARPGPGGVGQRQEWRETAPGRSGDLRQLKRRRASLRARQAVGSDDRSQLAAEGAH